jgi:hypothetical protein
MIRRLTEWRARLLAEPRGQAGAMLSSTPTHGDAR